jgi:glycosyltransferase involved in cell wall biosynthesis
MTKKRIPILQLIDGFATEEVSGGAAQFGIQLARHLDTTQYTPFVCGLWHYGTDSERRWRMELHKTGISTNILIEHPNRLETDMIRAMGLFFNLINQTRPQIVHSHFERGDLLALFSKVLHPSHPCIVRTMHADQQWQTRPWLGQLMNLAAFPWYFDAEVAISQATQQVLDRRLAARLRGRRSVLIYNAISRTFLEQFAPKSPEQQVQVKPPRLALIGRVEQQKGHVFFLQASVTVLRHYPDAEFWVVGTGSLLEAMQTLATDLGIAHAVHFLGQQNNIPDILQKINMLVVPSIWEGFPTVILEAMAASVPVVATDVSGSRELVRNKRTGLLIPVGQPDALAQAILWLLDNPDAGQRMAEHARHQVQQHTFDTVARHYDNLYRSCLHLGNILPTSGST